MEKKVIVLICAALVLVAVVALAFFSCSGLGCGTVTHYSLEEINNPKSVALPIDNVDEAIQYSLSLPQVRAELNNLSGPYKNNTYGWWPKAFATDEAGKPYWIVTWMNGKGECSSPYGCQIEFDPTGNIKEFRNFSCSSHWWCG